VIFCNFITFSYIFPASPLLALYCKAHLSFRNFRRFSSTNFPAAKFTGSLWLAKLRVCMLHLFTVILVIFVSRRIYCLQPRLRMLHWSWRTLGLQNKQTCSSHCRRHATHRTMSASDTLLIMCEGHHFVSYWAVLSWFLVLLLIVSVTSVPIISWFYHDFRCLSNCLFKITEMLQFSCSLCFHQFFFWTWLFTKIMQNIYI